jgi:hypothetical protein
MAASKTTRSRRAVTRARPRADWTSARAARSDEVENHAAPTGLLTARNSPRRSKSDGRKSTVGIAPDAPTAGRLHENAIAPQIRSRTHKGRSRAAFSIGAPPMRERMSSRPPGRQGCRRRCRFVVLYNRSALRPLPPTRASHRRKLRAISRWNGARLRRKAGELRYPSTADHHERGRTTKWDGSWLRSLSQRL